MPVEVQTRDAADQFTGTAGEGLFTWTDLDRLPRSSRVVLDTVDLRTIPGSPGAPYDEARIFLRPVGAAVTDPSVTIGWGRGNMVNQPDGSSDLYGVAAAQLDANELVAGGPPRLVPRTIAGVHWELAFVTIDKARKGFAIVDWHIETFTEGAQS